MNDHTQSPESSNDNAAAQTVIPIIAENAPEFTTSEPKIAPTLDVTDTPKVTIPEYRQMNSSGPTGTSPAHLPVPEEPLQSSASTVVAFDIEHVAVEDDPRAWPRRIKVTHISNGPKATLSRASCPQRIRPASQPRGRVVFGDCPNTRRESVQP